MDIFLRGIDPGAMSIIDDLARKSKLSRNEYLRNQLSSFAWLHKIQTERNLFEEAMKESINRFNYVEVRLAQQEKVLQRLSFLLMQAMDVTDEELATFEKEMNGESGVCLDE